MSFSWRWPALLVSCSTAAFLVHCTGSDPEPATAVPDSGGPGQPEGSTTPPPPPSDGSTPTDAGPPALLTNARTLAAGGAHTCAILADGSVACWGDNSKGQLGIPGTTPASSTPVRVPLGDTALSLAAGELHTCAVTSKHQILCWGDSSLGQIGSGPTDAGFRVVTYDDGGLPLTNIGQVAAGSRHSCAREVDSGAGVGFTSFTKGYCWGSNSAFQLGQTAPYGVTPNRPTAMQPLEPGIETTPLIQAFYADSLALGGEFGCARALFLLPGSGAGAASAFCWGNDDKGQLTRDGGTWYARPQLVFAPVGNGGVEATERMAAGRAHACAVGAVSATPSLICWGDNGKGQIGDAVDAGYINKARVTTGVDVTKISDLAAGGESTCVIESQAVKCIGANDQGQLGNGTVNTAANKTWISASGIANAKTIAVGTAHVCAALVDGRVMCWGKNANGQLGDGLDLAAGYPEVDRKYLRATPVAVRAPK